MSGVERGQMSAAETGQMSVVWTGQMSPGARPDISLLSAHMYIHVLRICTYGSHAPPRWHRGIEPIRRRHSKCAPPAIPSRCHMMRTVRDTHPITSHPCAESTAPNLSISISFAALPKLQWQGVQCSWWRSCCVQFSFSPFLPQHKLRQRSTLMVSRCGGTFI